MLGCIKLAIDNIAEKCTRLDSRPVECIDFDEKLKIIQVFNANITSWIFTKFKLAQFVIKGQLLLSSYEQLWVVQYGETGRNDLLLELKVVKLEILSTSFIGFLYCKLGEFNQSINQSIFICPRVVFFLRLRSLGLKGIKSFTTDFLCLNINP